MYHAIVKKRLRRSFDEINRGNYEAIVRQFATSQVEHWFSGDTALSGRRCTSEEIQEWYDRLAVIFPTLHFDITKLIVTGWPWDTHGVIEWVDQVKDLNGNEYSNQGVHIIRLKWGKAVELHVFCDTKLLGDICSTLGDQGNAAAVESPIGAKVPFLV